MICMAKKYMKDYNKSSVEIEVAASLQRCRRVGLSARGVARTLSHSHMARSSYVGRASRLSIQGLNKEGRKNCNSEPIFWAANSRP